MLIDLALTCAPIVAVAPAVAAVATAHGVFISRAVLQRRLYRSLLLAEKLPETTPGSRQIGVGIDRDTAALAYLTQYPQRGKDIAHIALIGLGVVAVLVAYYGVLATGGGWIAQFTVLALVIFAAFWLHRAVRNFVCVDTVTRELFIHFGAPAGLIRPRTDLVVRARRRTVTTVLAQAADVRDASATPLSTLDAVNIVLAAREVPWQAHVRTTADNLYRAVRRVDYRSQAKSTSV